MTTATTTTVINNTTNAGFQAWYNEIITQLLAVGLTQTTDTGQIGATAALPGTSTSAGFTIWKFNDTLQGTAPLFIKLEFGTGSAAGSPQVWLTIGTGTNGAGTLTGTISARIQCAGNTAPISTSTLYVSRWMYSATLGILWMGCKYNAETTVGPNGAQIGFIISRSNDATGASTGDAFFTITCCANGGTGNASGNSFMQIVSNLTSTIYPHGIASNLGQAFFAIVPFILPSNAFSGDVQVYPVFYMTPGVNISANVGVANILDITLAGTFSGSLVGSTSTTFIQAGMLGADNVMSGANQSGINSVGFILPWQ